MEEKDVNVTADVAAVEEENRQAEKTPAESEEMKSLEELKNELAEAEKQVERLKAEIEEAKKAQSENSEARPPVDKTILISMIPEEELEAERQKEVQQAQVEPEDAECEDSVEETQQHSNTDFNLCANCGAEFKDGEKFCGYCGSPLQQQSQEPKNAFCMNCGAKLDEDSKFCMNCGSPA